MAFGKVIALPMMAAFPSRGRIQLLRRRFHDDKLLAAVHQQAASCVQAVFMRDGRSIGDILVSEGLARTWTGRQPWCLNS